MDATTTMPHALTEAQDDVLCTMTRHARCVGADRTDSASGFVDEVVARTLVALGFAVEDVGQRGVAVFIITPVGYDWLLHRDGSE